MADASPQDFHIRRYQPGDEAALLELHNRAYAGHPPRTSAFWEWRFREHPSSREEILLAVDADGRPVAVHGGVRHRARVAGRAALVGLQGDTAVDPERAGGLLGGRLLARLIARHFAEFGGGDTPIVYGFPEPPLQRVGVRFVGFRVLRDLALHVRDAPPHDEARGLALRVERPARFEPEVDALWERCAPELDTALVRDAAYLNWRYVAHPDVPYTLHVARDAAGALRGVAVTREGGWDPALLSIMDWLVPRDDLDAERALLHACEQQRRERERSHLACWLAGDPERARRFQVRHGFHVVLTPHQQCARWWSPELDRPRLLGGWFQTLGDVDFF